MQPPDLPADEDQRLDALRALRLLDTPPEERFERITRLARHLFRVPIAAVSLVDSQRQWFKSIQGLDVSQTTREVSFCGHAIHADDLFCVPDASRDPRFADNPLVVGEPAIRFYAGTPLLTPQRRPVGTLCIIDRIPRVLSDFERRELIALGRLAERELTALMLATVDALTELTNRAGFAQIATRILEHCRANGPEPMVLVLDVGRMLHSAATHGEDVADRSLVAFAAILRSLADLTDCVARLDGSRFAAIFARAPLWSADRFGEMLHRRLTERWPTDRVIADPDFETSTTAVDPHRVRDGAALLDRLGCPGKAVE